VKPGRPRLRDDTIPRHIDQRKIPAGCYWDGRDRIWYTIQREYVPGRPKPKQRRRRIAGPTATLAELHMIIQDLTVLDIGTVKWLFELFEESEQFKKTLAKSTQDQYLKARKAIVDRQTPVGAIGKWKLASITRPLWQVVIDAVAKEGHPTKANHMLRFSRVAFRWGLNRGHTPRSWTANPADGVSQAKERKQKRMPTVAAFKAVLAYARAGAAVTSHVTGSTSAYLWPSMELAYRCRLRGIEVSTLTDAHALPEGIATNRRKGSRDNVVAWTPALREAWDALTAHRTAAMQRNRVPVPIKPEERYLIVSQEGTPLSKSGLDTAWQRLIRKAITNGVITAEQRFTMHGLKHRGVTDTKGNKADKQTASGHKSAQMLEHYDHDLPLVRPAGE